VPTCHNPTGAVLAAGARREAARIAQEVDGQRDRASEVLHFDAEGRVARGEVFYGVVPE
jgi:hypothetical protein